MIFLENHVSAPRQTEQARSQHSRLLPWLVSPKNWTMLSSMNRSSIWYRGGGKLHNSPKDRKEKDDRQRDVLGVGCLSSFSARLTRRSRVPPSAIQSDTSRPPFFRYSRPGRWMTLAL